MMRQHIRRWIGALALALLVSTAPRIANAEPSPVTPVAGELAPPPSAEKTPEEVNRRQLNYAEREAQNTKAADFKGGETGIYIGGSAVAIVLLIVLLVVLL